MTDRKDFLTREKFMAELYRYKKGSVTRRHFLGVTGLGLATSVFGSAVSGLRSAASRCRPWAARERWPPACPA